MLANQVFLTIDQRAALVVLGVQHIRAVGLHVPAHGGVGHLQVHPYTVRADQLPEYATNVNQLYDVLYNQAGVDGLFTDFPDKAVQFLDAKQ